MKTTVMVYFLYSIVAVLLVSSSSAWTTRSSSSYSSSSFHGVHVEVSPNTALSLSPSSSSWTMYQEPSGGDPPNAWSILSNTERWIHRTLAQTAVASSNGASSSNPYVRKEVSYVCEPTASPVLLVAAIFRQLQEMRRRGETHIQTELARAAQLDGTSFSLSLFLRSHCLFFCWNTLSLSLFLLEHTLIVSFSAGTHK
jgi:hypothetical protein